ncbi:uncharacterized protein DEA37_0002951 [Paragonimus westermani]|uniref:Uncharacterized protein n=1 Tax=Paragonimus westermani TaxID=34504 RepID=A0A5J4NVN1_9TREM|nr:uncharacterized protein DEA37_0002951 [Paragonimus westermani]
MEQRKEKLLNRLARVLQGEAVPFEDQLGLRRIYVWRYPTWSGDLVQLRKKRSHEAEFGGSTLSKRSPVESLLGEATVASLEGDRKLAHSAQMYHYQHQKQQMLAVDR